MFCAWFFLWTIASFGQTQFEGDYTGVLTLEDSTFISYQIYLSCEGSNCTGYSITDKNGANETKSELKGKLDSRTGLIRFKEVAVLGSHADSSSYDEFCFVHFSLWHKELMNPEKHPRLTSDFQAFFTDGVQCASGKLDVMYSGEMHEQIAKIKTKVFEKKVMKKILGDSLTEALVDKLDSVDVALAEKGERLGMSKTVDYRPGTVLRLKDIGSKDGDVIEVDNQVSSKRLSLDKKAWTIEVLPQTDSIFIRGIDDGKKLRIPLALEILEGEQRVSNDTILLEEGGVFVLPLHRKE